MARLLIYEEVFLNEENFERARERRRLRQYLFNKQIPDGQFVLNYRLNRSLYEKLCEEIIPLMPPNKNTRGIDPSIKILTALAFYGRGSYQGAVGLNMDGPLAQPTVSKCLKQVTEALNSSSILRTYIKFPQNRQERNFIKESFYEKYGFPGICGCIDCTHIAIVRPQENEERFFNRKHFHSINCQVICDANCNIISLDASYGGATHDSFIWQNSEICDHLESLTNTTDETAILLGDSGYPLRRYLMTPIDGAPDDSPEGHYNAKHKRVRSTIERTFGQLKGRWRCLLAARQLHYKPEMAAKITIACCVLHNMCVQSGLDPVELTQDELHVEAERQRRVNQHVTGPPLEQGQRTRNELIQLLNRNLR
ncbi:putative nuclease HARBI1 [Leptidea sinapis]|uniref:putative nuclease HARBI1 n=1 Tax=Leptidea sinapis TaxID=189913 RepID=UPI002128BEC2|nr:putative nuclease HARBI1 [Leptidea sinapis]XP_050678689.1 putative nuclease HARBI1 [Leptidea sinapis]